LGGLITSLQSRHAQPLAEKLVLERLLNSWVLAYISPFQLEEHSLDKAFEIESSRYSIEHILPESPSDDNWCQFNEQEETFTYRLGNMILLEASSNRDLGHSSYNKNDLSIIRVALP